MSDSLLKTDLSDTYVEEEKKFEELKLKGTNRKSDTISYPSTSSGKTYTSTIGETDLMGQLANVLYPYHITADDWNYIINKINSKQIFYKATLLNSWVKNNADSADVGYTIDIWGNVHLQGTVKGGKIKSTIFTFPSIYAPMGDRVYAVANGVGDMNAEVTVTSKGEVIANNPVGRIVSYLGLSNISFVATSYIKT